jgi:hypothetical protein
MMKRQYLLELSETNRARNLGLRNPEGITETFLRLQPNWLVARSLSAGKAGSLLLLRSLRINRKRSILTYRHVATECIAGDDDLGLYVQLVCAEGYVIGEREFVVGKGY